MDIHVGETFALLVYKKILGLWFFRGEIRGLKIMHGSFVVIIYVCMRYFIIVLYFERRRRLDLISFLFNDTHITRNKEKKNTTVKTKSQYGYGENFDHVCKMFWCF